MELKEWLDLLVVPGILIGGFYWLHQQIKAEVRTGRGQDGPRQHREEHRAGAGRREAGGLEGRRAGERDKEPAQGGGATGRNGGQSRSAGSVTMDSNFDGRRTEAAPARPVARRLRHVVLWSP